MPGKRDGSGRSSSADIIAARAAHARRLRALYENETWTDKGSRTDRMSRYGARDLAGDLLTVTTGVQPEEAKWAFRHPIANMKGESPYAQGAGGMQIPYVPGPFRNSGQFLKGGNMRMRGSIEDLNPKYLNMAQRNKHLPKQDEGGLLRRWARQQNPQPPEWSRELTRSQMKRHIKRGRRIQGKEEMKRKLEREVFPTLRSDIANLPTVEPVGNDLPKIMGLPETDQMSELIRRAKIEYALRKSSPSKLRERWHADQVSAGAADRDSVWNIVEQLFNEKRLGGEADLTYVNSKFDPVDMAVGYVRDPLKPGQQNPQLLPNFGMRLNDARRSMALLMEERGLTAMDNRDARGAWRAMNDARRIWLNQPGVRQARKMDVMDPRTGMFLEPIEQTMRALIKIMREQRGG